jgi:hypothetical protein
MALRILAEAYGFAVDRRDSGAFVALFGDDATVTVHDPTGAITGTYVGRSELSGLPQRLHRYDRTVHLVHNQEVRFGGSGASGEVYCTAHHVTGAGADAADRVLTIRYLDHYSRDDDRWRFQSREVRVQWVEERRVQR